MPRVHHTEITARFTHIDATFAGFELDEDDWSARYRVRFYPWWEHPSYLQARAEGRSWGFTDTSSGAIEVTVFAKNVREVRISQAANITDWAFLESHPLLLPFEPTVTLYCNGSLDLERLWGLVESVEKVVGRWFSPWNFLMGTPSGLREVAGRPSSCVGHLPVSVARGVHRYLEALGVPVFPDAPYPQPERLPKLLLLDDTDYLIADDFELDVPEVVHRPEYFNP